MNYAFRTIVITAAAAVLMRDTAAVILPSEIANMYFRKLSSTGLEPATHYISSGYIPTQYAAAMINADVFDAMAKAAHVTAAIPLLVTKLQFAAVLSQCDVSEDNPFAVMAAKSLILIP